LRLRLAWRGLLALRRRGALLLLGWRRLAHLRLSPLRSRRRWAYRRGGGLLSHYGWRRLPHLRLRRLRAHLRRRALLPKGWRRLAHGLLSLRAAGRGDWTTGRRGGRLPWTSLRLGRVLGEGRCWARTDGRGHRTNLLRVDRLDLHTPGRRALAGLCTQAL